MQTKIIELIAQVKDDPLLVTSVTDSSHLMDDVGLDSLQLINLILLIEGHFDVEVDFDSFEVDHLSSLKRFTEYVAGLSKT